MTDAVGEDGTGIGRFVRTRRRDAGLTQQALAGLAGVSVATIRDLEQGRTRRPRTALVDRLAVALGVARGQIYEQKPAARRDRGLWLGVLGPVTAARDGRALDLGEPRQRGVLGLLALNAGASVHRSVLVDAFWGQSPPVAAVNLIQAYVGRLRRVLDPDHTPRDGSGVVVSGGTSYRLHVDTEQLDWLEFRRQLAVAAHPDFDVVVRCDAYEQALQQWRGDPLADVDVLRGHPAIAAAAREWGAAVAGYAEAAFQAGLPDRVLPYLWQWTSKDPLQEKAHAMLMLALAGTGQQAAALDVFADVRDRLDAQLGVRPGPELCRAQVRVLRQEASGGPATAVAVQAPPVPHQLPAPVRRFVGRDEQLAALNEVLDSVPGSPGPAIAAVTGTAGIGKSTLALHWAHEMTDRFPDGQLYVNLRGYDPGGPPLEPAAAIRGFLDGLGLPDERVPRDPHAQAARYRSLIAGRRMLVVLDNARDSQQARPLLPGAAGAMVVITSRSELTGLVVGEGAETIDLPLLGETESLRLLANHLGNDWVARHADSAGELVRLCDRLPLALSIIGARAAAHPDSAATVLMEQLRDARGRLDVLTAGEASSDLRAVLGCSYGYLSAPAARLFRLLSIHPGPEVSAPAADSLAGAPSGVALAELTRAHLVIEQRPGRYALHDLLRVYASEQARKCDDAGERQAVVDRVLDHYLHTAHAAALLQEVPRDPLALPEPAAGVRIEPLTADEHASAWFDTEHAVLMRCVALAARTDRTRHAWQLSWTLMTAFSRSGHWSDLATALSLALDAADQAGDLTGQAWAHRFLGRVRTLQSEYEAALGHLHDALELFGRLGDAAGQAAVHVGLIRECERRGQHQAALDHAKRALELQRAAGYRVGETIALNNVGWCYVRLGQYTEAQSWCREALAAQQAIGYRPGEAYTWDTLGYAHHHLQQFDEATWCYRQALDLYRLLDDRYEQAATLARLGDTHAAAGDENAARSRWHQALDLLDELHHPDGDRLRDKLRRVTARV